MAEFRRHLDDKLSIPGFRAQYEGWCEACAHTMRIIGLVHAANTAIEDLAREIGVDASRVEAFLDAERCEYDVMSKLCTRFDVDLPASCARRPK